MSTRRLVDLALVALTGLLLAAGAVYWVAAAPLVAPEVIDQSFPDDLADVAALQEAVASQMSVVNGNALYETVILSEDEGNTWPVDLVPGNAYSVNVLCAGDGLAELELPTGPVPVGCELSGRPTSVTFESDGPTMVGVRQMQGDPLVVGVQILPD